MFRTLVVAVLTTSLTQAVFQCPDAKSSEQNCIVQEPIANAEATDDRYSYDVQLSSDATHTDWVPLGKMRTNNVLQVDISMGGCGAHHGFQYTITSGWQGNDGTVTMEDAVYAKLFDKPVTYADGASAPKLMYKNIPNDDGKSSGYVYLYLVYPESYGFNEGACAGVSNGMTFTVSSNFKGGYFYKADDVVKTAAANYMPVHTIDIALMEEMTPIITKHTLSARSDTDDDNGVVDHIPIGRVSVNDVLHLDVTVGGCGATHGYRISLYAEWLSATADTPDNKVFAYVQHQNQHVTSDALEIRYMGIPKESDEAVQSAGGKQSGDMYVYMYFNDDYGWHKGQCTGKTNSIQVKSSHSSLGGNKKFLPGGKDADFGTNERAGKYKLATLIDLATVGNMYTKTEVNQAIKDALNDVVDSACFLHPTDGGRTRRDEGHRCARETHLEQSKHNEVAVVVTLLVLMVGIIGGVWFYMSKGARQGSSGNYSQLSIQADDRDDDDENPFDGSLSNIVAEPESEPEEPDAFGAAVGFT